MNVQMRRNRMNRWIGKTVCDMLSCLPCYCYMDICTARPSGIKDRNGKKEEENDEPESKKKEKKMLCSEHQTDQRAWIDYRCRIRWSQGQVVSVSFVCGRRNWIRHSCDESVRACSKKRRRRRNIFKGQTILILTNTLWYQRMEKFVKSSVTLYQAAGE